MFMEMVVLVSIGVLLGTIVWYFMDYPWLLCAGGGFAVVCAAMGVLETWGEFKKTKCPDCHRPIRTSKPIKCVECGGAAMLEPRLFQKFMHTFKNKEEGEQTKAPYSESRGGPPQG